jgi:type I restriction enzyme S subunit
MNESREISSGWVWAKLGEVCKLKNGYAFKSSDYSKEGIPIIRISDINEGVVSVDESVKIIANQEYENYIIRKDEILVAMSGATTGKFGIFRNNIIAYQNQRVGKFQILDKNSLNNTFLLFLLYSLKRKILEDAYGGAQPNISSGKIEELEIPLPPFSEQHRIVAKIEELFSSLDKGIESLKTAQQQLKVYRQAVLKWAFEGRLTNKSVVEGELPEGWKKVKLGEVVKTIDGDRGPNYPKKDEFLQKGYCLFLSTKNVREDSFVFEDNIFISKEKDEKLRGGKLQLSDVVITTRGTLGNVALYDDKIPYKHIRINSGMLILRRTNESLNNYYLMKFITSPIFISQLKEKQTGTAQQQIPANVLREIEIPLAPLSKQYAIVAEIESRLSVCDKIEESIESSLKQSEALRQSIFKKAFEGKLVPQDPNDEPASVLLDRIRKERTETHSTILSGCGQDKL